MEQEAGDIMAPVKQVDGAEYKKLSSQGLGAGKELSRHGTVSSWSV
jgi:hypothetical protein